MLLNDTRVVALLDRMAAPALETRGEHQQEQSPERAPAVGAVEHAALAGAANAVIWNESVAASSAPELIRARLRLAVESVLELGGGTLAEQRLTLERLAGAADTVVVLTPAWEPPLLEFVDFLGELRAVVGASPSIIVMPVAEDARAITAIERENWSRAVGQARDTRAYIEVGEA
jgi:hypothetical protein